jgi:hypothetical protein
MGLDMYLTAKRYLCQYPEDGDDAKLAKAIGALPLGNRGMRVKEVSCEAMYWRKANAIHKWFVDNCQGGVDDCDEYYVDKEKLQKLADDCQKILDDHSQAPDVLPTQSGFFFGSTEFDEYFWEEIQRTVHNIRILLNNAEFDRWELYYRSSW